MRRFNFVARRENALSSAEKSPGNEGLVLRIKILGSNPQKFVNSFLFYSFSLRIFNFFYFTFNFQIIS